MGRIKDEALFQLIHDYLKSYLPEQRCSSPNTVRAYRTALEQLLDYAADRMKISLSALTFDMLDYEMVKNYLEWLVSEKGCSATTRNHRLACIRSFFAYASAMSPENIIRQTALSKIPKQKPAGSPRPIFYNSIVRYRCPNSGNAGFESV